MRSEKRPDERDQQIRNLIEMNRCRNRRDFQRLVEFLLEVVPLVLMRHMAPRNLQIASRGPDSWETAEREKEWDHEKWSSRTLTVPLRDRTLVLPDIHVEYIPFMFLQVMKVVVCLIWFFSTAVLPRRPLSYRLNSASRSLPWP